MNSDRELYLPCLIWYSDIDKNEILQNIPYRSITDLIIIRSPAVMSAMRLCGTDENYITGNTSDYEKFSALCSCIALMPAHRIYYSVRTVLRSVFGIEEELSIYNCDAVWSACNEIIADVCLTPKMFINMLGIESVCVKALPFDRELICEADTSDDCSDSENNSYSPDIYPILDLSFLSSPDSFSKYLSSIKNAAQALEEFICELNERIILFSRSGCSSAFIELSDSYTYCRNSKKLELGNIYSLIKSGGKSEGYYELANYILTSIASALVQNNIKLIVNIGSADTAELSKLFSYLKLNGSVPHTVLRGNDIKECMNFIEKFAVRTELGFPSVIPSTSNPTYLARFFPIGVSILDFGDISSVFELASAEHKSELARSALEAMSPDSDIADSFCVYNIKNLFSI